MLYLEPESVCMRLRWAKTLGAKRQVSFAPQLSMKHQCFSQLARVYDPNDPNFDYMKMEEERRRMREHVMQEVDKNRDMVISEQEFIQYSETSQFADPDENSYKVDTCSS